MKNHEFKPKLFIPRSFEECMSYEQQIQFLNQRINDLEQEIINLKKEAEDDR